VISKEKGGICKPMIHDYYLQDLYKKMVVLNHLKNGKVSWMKREERLKKKKNMTSKKSGWKMFLSFH